MASFLMKVYIISLLVVLIVSAQFILTTPLLPDYKRTEAPAHWKKSEKKFTHNWYRSAD